MRTVTLKGELFTLARKALKVGEAAPDFEVVTKDLKTLKLSDLRGKVVVINSVPSVDTPVCNKQIVRFNQEAALLHGAVILSVSMDLPFALDRYCGSNGIEGVITTSDYRYHDFGTKYGTLIEELQILSRAVFVVNKEGVLHYVEYVPETGNLPDFDMALAAVHQGS